jgi:outer membrane immunogenic protein
MKQLTCLTIAACASLALALTAFGGPESLPSGKEMKQVAPAPPPECDFTWTGFYFGGNAGYGWGNADTNVDPLPPGLFTDAVPITLKPDPSGFIGGGQIGFNWQWNKWLVLGIESDFQGTDIEGQARSSPIVNAAGVVVFTDSFEEAHERMQWFGSTRGRIGISPWCRVLLYATGGVAYGSVDYSANLNFGPTLPETTYPVDFTETKVGWTVGGGFEYAIGHHWTVKAEYLYYDLGNADRTQNQLFNGVPQGPPFFVHYNFETTGNIVRGGFNFKF